MAFFVCVTLFSCVAQHWTHTDSCSLVLFPPLTYLGHSARVGGTGCFLPCLLLYKLCKKLVSMTSLLAD